MVNYSVSEISGCCAGTKPAAVCSKLIGFRPSVIRVEVSPSD